MLLLDGLARMLLLGSARILLLGGLARMPLLGAEWLGDYFLADWLSICCYACVAKYIPDLLIFLVFEK